MAIEHAMSKETFLRIAETSGLDVTSTHIEELYTYLQSVLPGLQIGQKVNVVDSEPAVTFNLSKE